MREILYVSMGTGAGAAVAVLAFAIARLLPDATRTIWAEMLSWIAHPVAVIIAAIAGHRLQAEASMAIHLVAIVVTFMLVGAVAGWLVSKA